MSPALKFTTAPEARNKSEKAVPEAPKAPESFAVARTDGVVIEVANVGAVEKTRFEEAVPVVPVAVFK